MDLFINEYSLGYNIDHFLFSVTNIQSTQQGNNSSMQHTYQMYSLNLLPAFFSTTPHSSSYSPSPSPPPQFRPLCLALLSWLLAAFFSVDLVPGCHGNQHVYMRRAGCSHDGPRMKDSLQITAYNSDELRSEWKKKTGPTTWTHSCRHANRLIGLEFALFLLLQLSLLWLYWLQLEFNEDALPVSVICWRLLSLWLFAFTFVTGTSLESLWLRLITWDFR